MNERKTPKFKLLYFLEKYVSAKWLCMLSLATGPQRETGFLLQTGWDQDWGRQTAQESCENCPVCGRSFLSPILWEIVCMWFSMGGASFLQYVLLERLLVEKMVNDSAELASWWYSHGWSDSVLKSYLPLKPLCSALGWGAVFPQWPFTLGLQAFLQPQCRAWVFTLLAQPSPSTEQNPISAFHVLGINSIFNSSPPTLFQGHHLRGILSKNHSLAFNLSSLHTLELY